MSGKSPFLSPLPVETREGGPSFRRPSREDVKKYPDEAAKAVSAILEEQESARQVFDLDWTEDKHFLLCGATGTGLGACLAAFLVASMKGKGSVTLVSRDLKASLNYETGVVLERLAGEKGVRFEWINTGTAVEGEGFKNIVEGLRKNGSSGIVYINSVAYAFSGIQPGFPPVFVRDLDEKDELIQWKLGELSSQQLSVNRSVMGEDAVSLPLLLGKEGLDIAACVFCDWRGSLDRASRIPELREYGRQGAYSTSLFMPKEIIQERVKEKLFQRGPAWMDVFFPIMETPALKLLPGGRLIRRLMKRLLEKCGLKEKKVSFLALELLHLAGQNLEKNISLPFPRLDFQDSQLDPVFFHVLERLDTDEKSPYYYRLWI